MNTATPERFRVPAPEPLENAPGPLTFVRMLQDNPIAALTKAHFQQAIVFTNTVLGQIVVVSDPAAIRWVLLDNSVNYRRERGQRRMMEVPFGTSLLVAEGDLWRTQRRCLAPAFAAKTVESFAAATALAAAAAVERWMNFADGSVHALDWLLDRAMIDVAERTIFSDGLQRDPDEVTDKLRLFYALLAKPSILDILDAPPWIPRWSRMRRRPVHEFFVAMAEAIVEARTRRLEDFPSAAPIDVMSLLVQSGGTELSRQDVLANVFTIFAAVEPVASALMWALYLVSRAPEWRELLEAEADRELPHGRHKEGSLSRLVATRAVLEEALRLYPPIATIHREAVGADELSGHTIAPDTIVIIAPWVVHRHRLLWDQPDLFDPSRFLPEARTRIDRFAYLPFGIGPRTRIGGAFGLQTAIILLATIVRRFRLDLAPGHEIWPVLHVSLRPRGGLPMIFHRRS